MDLPTALQSIQPPRQHRINVRLPHTPGYLLASLAVSLGGFLNGFDTGSIGAVTDMEQFAETFGVLSPQLRGFTVSLIMLTGVIPSFFAGQMADKLGRLQVVSMGATIFAIGAALQAGASHLAMLLVGRALCGFGQGMWVSNIVVYISEIAPAKTRGVMVSLPQLVTSSAICFGYFTCYGSVKIHGSMAWRLPFIIMASAAMLLVIVCYILPQSPRWLMARGRREEAERELQKLGVSRAEAEKDILSQVQAAPSLSLWGSLALIFRRPYRRMTGMALFVLGMVQLCGIDGVLYYAPTLFKQAGLPGQEATFLASGVSAILMLAISIPGTLFADRWGRRTAIISGGLMLSGSMLLIGSLYASDSVHAYGSGRWVVVVSIFAFALAYCFTWNVTAKLVACEIQPANTRAAAICTAQGLNFFSNWLVAFATPIFLANSSSGAYFLYGALSLFTVIVLWISMPETRGRSLEDIQQSLQRPVRWGLKFSRPKVKALSGFHCLF
ncbi:general substrate transporter [Rhizodiscina lignyota]|uniref:General substrate transporter n=1 Tax=Rhizodiscina lignyota TaxID=1504668 RepID=A0A9P4MG74_9PEZI|nr:general substrate transporter [Rhizodiscina lignyota]